MNNDTQQLKWDIDGVDYEYITSEDFYNDQEDGDGNKFREVYHFTYEMSELATQSQENGENTAESSLQIDGDHMFNPRDGRPINSGCVVAKKEGKVVGVLKIDYDKEGGEGYLDKGVVSRDARKENKTTNEGQPVSEVLLRLSLAVLVGKYGNEKITGEPASERGRKYVLNNGLEAPQNGEKGKYGKDLYTLDARVVEAMKEALETMKKGDEEVTPEQLLELKKISDTQINEIKNERDFERNAGMTRR